MTRLLRCGWVLALGAGCVIPPLEAGGKTCAAESPCPAPYRCEQLPTERRCVESVSFQEGVSPDPSYDGTRDTYLVELGPDGGHGAEPILRVDGDDGVTTGKKVYGLLRFALPEGTLEGHTLLAAKLSLHVTEPSIGTFELRPLLRTWEEDALWNPSAAAQWQSPGGTGGLDRSNDVVGTLNPQPVGPLTVWLDALGVDWVRQWLAAAANNHGLMISTAHYDGAQFSSREDPVASSRPELVLYYGP